MKETPFVNKIKVYLKSQGAWVLKTHGHEKQQAGLPDLVISHKGRFAGIEVKVGDNRATELQRLTLMEISKSGGKAIIVCLTNRVVTVSRPLSPYKDEIIAQCLLNDFLDGGWLMCFLEWTD